MLTQADVEAAVAQETEGIQSELTESEASAAEAERQYLEDEKSAVAEAVSSTRKKERRRSTEKIAQARTSGLNKGRTEGRAAAKQEAAVPPTQPRNFASGGGGTDPRFSYCYEANDAGYGPYYRGQDPEYDWYYDRDGDGIVCER